MAYKRGERDHRDMLSMEDPTAKAKEPVYYSKPDWMVQAPVTRSNVEMPSTRLPPYLTHDNPAPSLDAYNSKPAPFSEDGVSAFRRDDDYSSSYKLQALAEKTKPGQRRNAGGRQESAVQSRDEDALWNFTRRSPIKGRTGELETEFRSQPGNLTTGMEIESYTPTTTPPTRSAGSDRTPSKSMYQEQCDQIWAHHRRRTTYADAKPAGADGSPAGKATSNLKYNPFTGAREGEQQQLQQQMTQQYREEEERQRNSEEVLSNHYPPWATHEGEDGAIPLKNG